MYKNITQKSIAEELDISISTVSRALANDKRININTKKKIQDLAKRLNYRPNLLAKHLKKNDQTFTIGVILPKILHYFFSSILTGIEQIAKKSGYNVIIMQSNDKEKTEKKCLQKLLQIKTDGILISLSKTSKDFSHFNLAEKSDTPVVLFDRITKEVKTNFVVIDDYQAAYNLTNHLIEMGCKQIIHLTSPQNLLISLNRKKGYLDALKKNRLKNKLDELIYIYQADSYSKAYTLISELCETKLVPFDGIFACNDLAAAGAIKAVRKYNKKIPEDICIGSFTNSYLAKALDITSVHQKGKKIGKLAMRILIKKINNKENHNSYDTRLVKSSLIIRKSTLRKF